MVSVFLEPPRLVVAHTEVEATGVRGQGFTARGLRRGRWGGG